MPSIFDEARVIKVFAGAGCGKTHFIRQQIANLLTDGISPIQIMYLLFNKKPAVAFRAEYKDIEDEELVWWGTHHSICKRLLKLGRNNILNLPAWGKEQGFDLHTEEEIKERGFDELGWDAIFASLQKKIYMANNNFSPEEERLLSALKETEKEDNKYCHVRYLQKALNMDLFPVGVKYVFADEAQDNGKLQMDWLSRLRDRPDIKGILLAGDDKQAINGFKGGSADLFLDFPADKTIEITKTYRLPSKILSLSNDVIGPVRKRSSLTIETDVKFPGQIVHTNDISETATLVQQALQDDKSVLVLCRNRCFIPYVESCYRANEIPIASAWHERVHNVVSGLYKIKLADALTEESFSAILPDYKDQKDGQLSVRAYWADGVVEKLRRGDFLNDKVMLNAYDTLRLAGSLPLDRACEIGFTPDFIEHVRSWSVPYEKWNMSPANMFLFKTCTRRYGARYNTVRVDTIHSVKGEEADVVVLVANVTNKTMIGELDNEDDERRVWYVASSRAKDTLIISSVGSMTLKTKMV